ncbi:transglutaminase family protein, partial [Acinetobacter baumannii]
DSPMGLRLPLNSLPWVQPEDEEYEFPPDPFASKSKLAGKRIKIKDIKHASSGNPKPQDVIKTALAVEVRNGHISLFVPPLSRLEDYLNLL